MRRLHRASWLAGVLALGAQASAPSPKDFASGIELPLPRPAPAYELELPPEVYQRLTRRDLADMRVFNDRGEVVQHALCAPRLITRTEQRHQVLPHFGLPPGSPPATLVGPSLRLTTPDGARIDYQQARKPEPTAPDPNRPADGPAITIQAPQVARQAAPDADSIPRDGPKPVPGMARDGHHEYIIDARMLALAPDGLLLDWDWRNPEGRAELNLRVDGSQNLDAWQNLVERSTLLRAGAADRHLERSVIELPATRFAFLRLRPLDPEPRDWLRGVEARTELVQRELAPLRWQDAEPANPDAESPSLRHYRNSSLAPVRAMRLSAPPDLLLQVRLSSRPGPEARWRERVQGQIGGLADPAPPSWAIDPPVQDSHWRLQISQGMEALDHQPVRLELAYTPLRLRILARGPGPYLLAFGSARADSTPLPACASFGEQALPIDPGATRELGGEASLRPPTEALPARTILLWLLLAAGALLVVWMALSLLRQLRPDDDSG